MLVGNGGWAEAEKGKAAILEQITVICNWGVLRVHDDVAPTVNGNANVNTNGSEVNGHGQSGQNGHCHGHTHCHGHNENGHSQENGHSHGHENGHVHAHAHGHDHGNGHANGKCENSENEFGQWLGQMVNGHSKKSLAVELCDDVHIAQAFVKHCIGPFASQGGTVVVVRVLGGTKSVASAVLPHFPSDVTAYVDVDPAVMSPLEAARFVKHRATHIHLLTRSATVLCRAVCDGCWLCVMGVGCV